jgi:hypothetical protein
VEERAEAVQLAGGFEGVFSGGVGGVGCCSNSLCVRRAVVQVNEEKQFVMVGL